MKIASLFIAVIILASSCKKDNDIAAKKQSATVDFTGMRIRGSVVFIDEQNGHKDSLVKAWPIQDQDIQAVTLNTAHQYTIKFYSNIDDDLGTYAVRFYANDGSIDLFFHWNEWQPVFIKTHVVPSTSYVAFSGMR
jgi:hypothetical protein